ncbi:hypothetical protein [Bifidobacterium tibiigranuli]|jgi:hypothetical protein|uniref:hypothetical protein n=1 Tax=Bifidobacterium tibiigranuli TaxID=2172043 RepID=UPI0026ED1E3B|nr:hypothetical protein [Bifidobacterium tibiigranuli]MCI1649714.1 hypothetical protein [Bifidobacterium tibiigranuli]MCI1673500.1 hypothetical protein [Bifidobacterium tibiigranuli]MCI1712800.1 hypothetical protein [Bifidobacterium tibiigranuli]MCI1833497.1 hypothetical protein [Bifidobacterium tibiigranuli]MCI2185444.1 hypothetical protein [Bifidobacterium tibiigranuli]
MTTPDNSNTTTPANAGVSAKPSGSGSNDGAAQPWMHTEAIILWASWAAMLVFNAFAELGKLGGVTTEEVSNEATTWFMPAGYAFTIWVVIYIALALWVVILSRDKGRERLGPLPITTRGALFVVTCALNIAWLAVWHSRQLLASIILIALLLIAVWTLCAMSRGQEHNLLDWVPLSLYGSWLAVATIANIMHVVSRYFDPKGSNIIVQSISTLALLVLLVAISVFMNARMHDWVCGVVVIWSTVAIGVHLMDTSRFFAVVLIVFATLSAIVIYLPWRRLLPQQQQDQAA